ncbi:hypothetical protein [Nocardia testacea]|uniref:hypothetical protein n=1 Tax=Nocardia testacea TaxID=248551 RepID=UPI0002D56389|nr:hypothetical protein [Nocardia testacea]
MSSFLSFLSLMLILPGLAAAAAYVAVAVSMWLESRQEAGDPATAPQRAPGRV